MTPTLNASIKEYLASIEGVEKVYDVTGHDTNRHGDYITCLLYTSPSPRD